MHKKTLSDGYDNQGFLYLMCIQPKFSTVKSKLITMDTIETKYSINKCDSSESEPLITVNSRVDEVCAHVGRAVAVTFTIIPTIAPSTATASTAEPIRIKIHFLLREKTSTLQQCRLPTINLRFFNMRLRFCYIVL